VFINGLDLLSLKRQQLMSRLRSCWPPADHKDSHHESIKWKFSRIVLNTGIRPPKEVLSIKKEHVNLSNESRYFRLGKTDLLIPPKAVLVAKGKNGRPRVLPLNRSAQAVFKLLLADNTTGECLFLNRAGEPMKAIKKGFAAACVRAAISDLRPYDLRHTFATRLLERGVHQFVISTLLGHSTPASGFGQTLESLRDTLIPLGS
jgi:integrase